MKDHPLEDYPLDDVDIDTKISENLALPGISSYHPEDGPGVRYSKFIPLDEMRSRLVEFFVEAKINDMPSDIHQGYVLEDVKMVSGVMMRRKFGEMPTGEWRTVSQYLPEERFIEEFLNDPSTKIKVYQWFAEIRSRAEFDDDTLASVNQSLLPTLSEDPDKNPFKRVLQ